MQKSVSPSRNADGQLPLCFLLDVDGQVLDQDLFLMLEKTVFNFGSQCKGRQRPIRSWWNCLSKENVFVFC